MNSDMMWDLDIDDMYGYKGWWTTKDGEELKIELMESSHIRNTIKLLQRNLEKVEEYEKQVIEDKIEEFEEELKKRDVYKRHTLGRSDE